MDCNNSWKSENRKWRINTLKFNEYIKIYSCYLTCIVPVKFYFKYS